MQGVTHYIHEWVACFLLGPILKPPKELPDAIHTWAMPYEDSQSTKSCLVYRWCFKIDGQHSVWKATTLQSIDRKTLIKEG